MRPTRRAFGLVVAAALLVLIGTNTQAGWLYALASLVLGAVLAGFAIPPGMVRGVTVERRAPEEAFAGDDVAVDLVVRNTSRRSKLALSIRDPHIAETIAYLPSLGPREEVVLSTTRHAARRGVVDGAPVTLISSAPFGVARARKRIAAPGRTVIYPRVVPVEWMPEVASATKPMDAAHVRARKGVGQDFISVREYQQGDSLRYVHWPTTARLGQLMVREFEQELPRRLGILVDTWGDAAGENGSVLDAACSVAASLATHAVAAGHPLTMAAARDQVVRGIDEPDQTDALTWLAELQAPGGPPLSEAIGPALTLLGRLDTLVVVVPTWSMNAVQDLVPRLSDLDEADLQLVVVLVEADTYARGSRAAPMLALEGTDELARAIVARGAVLYRVRADEELAVCLMQPQAA